MTYELPTDLLRLQQQFYDLDRRCQELAAALPPAIRIIAADPTSAAGDDAGGNTGGAEPLTAVERAAYQDERAAYEEAKAKRLEIVIELNRHPWWEGKASEQDKEGDPDAPQVRDRAAAKRALQEAARGAAG